MFTLYAKTHLEGLACSSSNCLLCRFLRLEIWSTGQEGLRGPTLEYFLGTCLEYAELPDQKHEDRICRGKGEHVVMQG